MTMGAKDCFDIFEISKTRSTMLHLIQFVYNIYRPNPLRIQCVKKVSDILSVYTYYTSTQTQKPSSQINYCFRDTVDFYKGRSSYVLIAIRTKYIFAISAISVSSHTICSSHTSFARTYQILTVKKK